MSPLDLVLVLLLVVVVILYLKARGKLNYVLRTNEQLREQLKSVEVRAREWLKTEEKRIRKDAVKRSQRTIKGQVAEKLAPYAPSFPYDPRDARFLGSPVDFVVFDGLAEGKDVHIIFLEVKTGKSRLTRRERDVQEAVQKSAIWFEEIRFDNP